VTVLRSRSGTLLAEAIVSLALGLLVIAAFAGALVGSLRWIAVLWARAEALDVVHTVWTVLDEELRPGMPGRDWQVHDGGDWVSLRAYRGLARVCTAETVPGLWPVAFRGRREPEPERDSVLVLGGDGGWRAFALESVQGGGGCVAREGEIAQRWGWTQGSAPPPVLVRLYERGEYHLADGALRYRRGGGGRQPLTPERLGAGSGFSATARGLDVTLELVPPNGGAGEFYRWSLKGAAIPPGASGGP
jgi:hypothetical protein